MPSFAIEVAGEANPLDQIAVERTLQAASSTVSAQIQSGTKQLQAWEKSPGYYRFLQDAYLNQGLPIETRYLAIIQLKNGIEKYWRKTAANAVPKDDKAIIRDRVVQSCINEVDERLALQNALLIAKIARFEYPQDWPDLLSSLTAFIRRTNENSPLHTVRCLLILLQIVKELSTARLQRSRNNLQIAAPEIIAVLGTLWQQTTAFWVSRINSGDTVDQDVTLALHVSLLALKILRRLVVLSIDNPNRDGAVVEFWSICQQRWREMLTLPEIESCKGTINKNVSQIAKYHQNLAKDHPAAFALLPNTPVLVQEYWTIIRSFGEGFGHSGAIFDAGNQQVHTTGSDAGTLDEKLALRGLLILRACVKMLHKPAQTFKYKTPEDKEERDQAKQLMSAQILTPDFVRALMETIVTKYFVFREVDLHEWEEEPEEWEKREEGDGDDWEFSIRSCSEKLFLDLAIHYESILSTPLLQVFHNVANLANEDVLLKDSLYTAIGLAAAALHERLDFDAFVRDVLTQEVRKAAPGFKLLRRRAAILLGQWAPVGLGVRERPLVYQIFQHLLDKGDPMNDLVVRVNAGRQLHKLVTDWGFEGHDFLSFADNIIVSLMNLISETESADTKLALLNTLSAIVEHMDSHILPFADRIVGLLPPLWQAAEDEHIMKQAILTILTRLVNALKASSAPLHSLTIPIIKSAVEPDSEIGEFLLEDAMDLWSAILTQSLPPAVPELLGLIPNLYPIYETGSEGLRKALEITKSYILLAPSHMLRDDVRLRLLQALCSQLGELSKDANGLVCDLIEVIVRAAQSHSDEAAGQIIIDLGQIGLLGRLLDGLRGSYLAHCTTGPLADSAPVDGMMESDYFSVLSRMILSSLDHFCHACASASPTIDGQAVNFESTMKWLLAEWFSHFENVASPARRKLMCFALTRLLETKQEFILVNLQSLMTVWTDVVIELREDAKDVDSEAPDDCLVYSVDRDEVKHDEYAAPEDDRLRALTGSDIVHAVKMSDYIKHHLQAVIASLGAQYFEREWLSNVDKDVIAAFQGLNIM